jgi:hypothetical protein
MGIEVSGLPGLAIFVLDEWAIFKVIQSPAGTGAKVLWDRCHLDNASCRPAPLALVGAENVSSSMAIHLRQSASEKIS